MYRKIVSAKTAPKTTKRSNLLQEFRPRLENFLCKTKYKLVYYASYYVTNTFKRCPQDILNTNFFVREHHLLFLEVIKARHNATF